MPLLGIAILIIIFDQMSKYIVRLKMLPGETIPLFPKIFHLTYVQNPGAAFGMLPHRTDFFIGITILVIFAILFLFHRLGSERVLSKVGLSFQLGGAVGNLIDRLNWGHVTDFFDFQVWPVFNIADIAIVIGVGLLCWDVIRLPTETEKQGMG